MQALGIDTGFDLRQRSRVALAEHFGKSGDYLYGVARGIDDWPVQADRVRKSVGAGTTSERDLLGWDEVAPALTPLFAKVWDACSSGHAGRTVTVKLKMPTSSRSPAAGRRPGRSPRSPRWSGSALICCGRCFRRRSGCACSGSRCRVWTLRGAPARLSWHSDSSSRIARQSIAIPTGR